jgi:hypothetical protein
VCKIDENESMPYLNTYFVSVKSRLLNSIHRHLIKNVWYYIFGRVNIWSYEYCSKRFSVVHKANWELRLMESYIKIFPNSRKLVPNRLNAMFAAVMQLIIQCVFCIWYSPYQRTVFFIIDHLPVPVSLLEHTLPSNTSVLAPPFNFPWFMLSLVQDRPKMSVIGSTFLVRRTFYSKWSFIKNNWLPPPLRIVNWKI